MTDFTMTVGDDGVAVIRLPSFLPNSVAPPPPDIESEDDPRILAYLEAVEAVYLDAFDRVKDAPAIIWDARANQGGVSPAALSIVNGMPGARAMELSYCEARIPGSDPVELHDGRTGAYSVEPGGPFAYDGKVAVLVDGSAVSAGDYFALAVKRATDVPLVGTPTAGGYGTPGPTHRFGQDWSITTDLLRCADADGNPLEGNGVAPDVVVEYDPADLARGVDTVLERAVSLVAP